MNTAGNRQLRNKAGRPPIIECPGEFDRLVGEYTEECENEGIPITLTGMALHLGFSSRKSLYDYQQRDGFCDSVRKARLRVEHEYELRLHGPNVSGAIFALKNFGWSDRRQIDFTNLDDLTDEQLAQVAAGRLPQFSAEPSAQVRERLKSRIAAIGESLRGAVLPESDNGSRR